MSGRFNTVDIQVLNKLTTVLDLTINWYVINKSLWPHHECYLSKMRKKNILQNVAKGIFVFFCLKLTAVTTSSPPLISLGCWSWGSLHSYEDVKWFTSPTKRIYFSDEYNYYLLCREILAMLTCFDSVFTEPLLIFYQKIIHWNLIFIR